jgi:diketogulonate reductase-like aldo/keto reductase
MEHMRRPVLDLIQVHNLLDWQSHLSTLQNWKAEGKLRYTGITHYQAAYHAALEKVFLREKVDFVQFNYSIGIRHAEERLLQAAADRGVAVIVNEPFEKGTLFERVKGRALPDWAAEYEIHNWAQFFLKFILAQPAVTCIIPGTSDPLNLASNMGAAGGPKVDQHLSREMILYFEKA